MPKFTYRTVKFHDAYGRVYKTTCVVRVESGSHVQETTFANWKPEAEALRMAETAYRADRLREIHGRSKMSFTTVE